MAPILLPPEVLEVCCPDHPDALLAESEGYVVCQPCGLALYPICGFEDRQEKECKEEERLTQGDYDVLDALGILANRAHMPQSITHTAASVYTKHRKGLHHFTVTAKGKAKKAALKKYCYKSPLAMLKATAALYIACHQHKVPRTYTEINSICGLHFVEDIAVVVRKMSEEPMSIRAKDLVPRFVAYLDCPFAVEKRAIEFLDSRQDELRTTLPETAATLAIMEGSDMTPFTGRPVLPTQEVVDVTGAALRTIRGVLLKLKRSKGASGKSEGH